MLVFREKQRQLEKLESIKSKIEHKYMYGEDLVKNLSHKGLHGGKGDSATDREGMIREVDSIPAQKAPTHYRTSSVQPTRNARLGGTWKKAGLSNLYADPSQQSI